ncbi:MAG TPA: hydrogenase maturation nickel metallochaperone HypA [Kofleriaceae bacterium]|nr:hydrogenase maturation nickel metallochaperone HypA [Kofleriaceae bacterium]
MHEYSIVASLVERVEDVVAAHPGAVVRRVHVQIGDYAGVEVTLLRTAYDVFRERTVCETAELAIEPTAGDELMLARVEMEVPDV